MRKLSSKNLTKIQPKEVTEKEMEEVMGKIEETSVEDFGEKLEEFNSEVVEAMPKKEKEKVSLILKALELNSSEDMIMLSYQMMKTNIDDSMVNSTSTFGKTLNACKEMEEKKEIVYSVIDGLKKQPLLENGEGFLKEVMDEEQELLISFYKEKESNLSQSLFELIQVLLAEAKKVVM